MTIFLKRRRLLIPIMAFLLLASSKVRAEGMKIYLSRHAETMGNVTRDYGGENQRIFSPKGKEQVAGIAEVFKGLSINRICVSPTWRTQHTILPYLKAQNRTGEIWAEFEEGSCDVGAAVIPATLIPLGDEIKIIAEGEGVLFLREDTTRRYEPTTWEESIGAIKKGLDRLKAEYSQTGKSVLIMSHSCTGARIMELLLGLDTIGRFGPHNASLTLLEEQVDGSFRLLLYNEEPFQQKCTWRQISSTRPFKPGGDLTFALYPERFSIPAIEGYVLKWKVLDDEQILKSEGRTAFTVVNREKSELTRLEVNTEGAFYGETWVLDAALYDGDQEIQSWQQPFLIPSYKNLSGAWLIQEGDDPAWAEKGFDDRDWKMSETPGGWEQKALPGYDGTAWYRLHFRLTDDDFAPWEQHPMAVVFGAIDDADETYLNGEKIGQAGTFPPAEVTAWDQLRMYTFDRRHLLRDNVLAVRVSDWGGGGGIWKGPVAIGPIKELQMAVDLER